MGFAPLHAAVETGFAECLAPLLEARADPNLLTEDAVYQLGQTSTLYLEGGRTALHIAVQKGDPAAVSALLVAGANAEQRDSFGLTVHDLLIENVASHSSREMDKAVATLLGVTLPIVQLPTAEDVRARRQDRTRALQLRIGEARRKKDVDERASAQQAILERYTPFDEAIARGMLGSSAIGNDVVSFAVSAGRRGDAMCSFRRALAVTGSRETGAEEPFPGVFVFPLLSASLCARIWAESEHYHAQAAELELPLPVRHDGGLDLFYVFPQLIALIAEAAAPAIRKFLPSELHGVSLRHGFRTKNFVGREEALKRHVDKYDVTLNVCIRKTPDVQGSGVFFFTSDSAPEPAYRHEHAVGLAVLHSSKELHQTEPLAQGERGSLILWFSHA